MTQAADAARPLDQRVAVVTGGGSGIGEAIAIRFAAAGAHVVVAGRTRPRLAAVAERIDGTAVVADVSLEDEVRALFEQIEADHGRLDVLVNNAGVTGPVVDAQDMDMAAFDQTIAINVRGVVLCTKHALPLLRRAGGAIVNMSSLTGLRGQPMRTAYTASKFAVIGITEAVAQEVGPHGVRVNALCPGAVHGELMERVVAERVRKEGRTAEEIVRAAYTDRAALRRWVDPEDVAEAALFLATDASKTITGERIKVDAGRM